MTKDEALKLCDELWQLVGRGPGSDQESLRRVDAIVNSFRWHPQATGYLQEKAGTVGHDFNVWLSPRKWMRFGAGGEFKSTLYGSVYKLKGAIEAGHGPR